MAKKRSQNSRNQIRNYSLIGAGSPFKAVYINKKIDYRASVIKQRGAKFRPTKNHISNTHPKRIKAAFSVSYKSFKQKGIWKPTKVTLAKSTGRGIGRLRQSALKDNRSFSRVQKPKKAVKRTMIKGR